LSSCRSGSLGCSVVGHYRVVSASGCGLPAQVLDAAPEILPLLAFGFRQFGEAGLLSDCGEEGVSLPLPQPLRDDGFGLGVAFLRLPAPPGQVGAEPGQGLLPPGGAILVVELVGVLALAAASQGSGESGVVASA